MQLRRMTDAGFAGIARSLFQFSLPLILSGVLQQLYSWADAFIVGRVEGELALAAVGATGTVVNLFLTIITGFTLGLSILCAQKYGSGERSAIPQILATFSLLFAVLFLFLAAAGALLSPWALRLLHTPSDALPLAEAYLRIVFAGIPFLAVYNVFSAALRGLGDSRTPFWFLLFSTVLNIALDLFCILTLGWGVLGAAVATVVSQGVSAALCFAYMHRHFEILRSTRDERRFRSRHARTLLAIGLPMGLQFSITAIGSIMLQSANNALGSACVAAFTAGVRIKMFVISPFESLGMAMATYTGHNYGAVKPERIWQGIKVAAGLMLGYALFAFVVLMAGSDLLARLFIDPSQSEILADTRLFLHVASYFLPVLGLLCILRYTIQGAGYTNLAMLSGVSEMIARTAVSLWAVPALGYIAVCFGDPTAWIAADLFLVPAFVYVYGRLKRMTPPEKPIGGR